MSEIKKYDFNVGDLVTEILTDNNYIIYKVFQRTDKTILYSGKRLDDNGNYRFKTFFSIDITPFKKEKQAKAFIKLLDNLNREADKAGGSGWTLEQLEKMTAADLLCTLCTNNLRFKYEPLGE